jgi:hypothetical protein
VRSPYDLPPTDWVESDGIWTRQAYGREYRIASAPRWFPVPLFPNGQNSIGDVIFEVFVFMLASLISLGQRPKVVVERVAHQDRWSNSYTSAVAVASHRLAHGEHEVCVVADFRAAVDAGAYAPGPDELVPPITRWWRRCRGLSGS